jgi:hypothetical protein
MRREAVWWLVGLAWLAAVAGGVWAWERYDATAGPDGPAAPTTPASARWQLTVFVHPHCPCARATLTELAEVRREVPDLLIGVVFVCPPGTPAGWERGRLWDAAARLPDVELRVDPGTEARRLGAETSGLAVVATPDGRVVFRGGLTRARGREGDSAGRRAVLDWVHGGSGPAAAPVFGCPLFASDD